MKKLMVMMTAAVVGACAWATDFTTSVLSDIQGMATGRTDIVGYDSKDPTKTVVDSSAIVHWWADNWSSSGYEQPATVASNDTLKANFLKIETDAGQPMQRTFSKVTETGSETGVYEAVPVNIQDHGLFVDTEVQFTGTDTAPTLADDNQNKLLVWLRTIESDDTVDPAVEGSTNLMVTCGYVDNLGAVTPTNYVLNANVDPAQWYRLTIRADKGQNNVPSFKIYLDGTQLTATVDEATVSQFPSLIKGSDKINLTFAGFEGTGNIKDVDLLTQSDGPAFAKDPTYLTISWTTGVTGFTLGDLVVNVTGLDYTSTNLLVAAGATTLTAAINTPTYKFDKFSDEGTVKLNPTTVDNVASFTIPEFAAFEACEIKICAVLDREEATITVNGEPVTTQGTLLQNILNYVNGLGEDDVVAITLGNKASLGNVTLSSLNNLDDFEGTLVLDLHGCTIEGVTAGQSDDYLFNTSSATLTIKDTVGGGAMIAYAGTGLIYSGYELTMDTAAVGDIAYTGAIINGSDISGTLFCTMYVYGGKFTVIPTTGVEGHLDDGITLGTDEKPLAWSAEQTAGFWTLVDATYTLTVSGGANATKTVNGAAYTEPIQATVGKYAIVATPESGYTYTGVELSGWTLLDNGSISNEVTIARTPGAVTVTAPDAVSSAEPTKYVTVTISKGENVASFTIKTNDIDVAVSATEGQYIVVSNVEVTVTATAASGYIASIASTDYTINSGVFTADKSGTVNLTAAEPAVVIGDKPYATLGAAVTDLTAGQTVKLVKSYTAAADEDLKFGVNSTLDLNGFTLTANGTALGAKKFDILAGATVTLTNGTIELPDNNGGRGILVHGALNVKCSITHLAQTASYGGLFDLYEGAVVSVFDGAVLTAPDCDIFRFKDAGTAETLNASTVNIYGGTITSGYHGDTTDGYNMFYAQYNYRKMIVNITGGDLTTVYPYFGFNGTANTVVDMELGADCAARFSTNVFRKAAGADPIPLSNYVADGYALVKNGEWYQVEKVYDITITAPENGTLETSVTNNIVAGTTVTVTATANTGYTLKEITTNTVALAGASFEMPADDVTVAAVFTANVYQVTYTYTDGTSELTDVTNTNPTEYTFGVGIASFDASKVSKEGYENPTFSPTSIATDATGTQNITVTLTKSAPTTFEITWSGENIVVTNATTEAEVTTSPISLAKDTVLKFYATVGTITNVTVNGTAQTAADPFVYTVAAEAATIVVKAGQFAPAPSSGEIKCETEQQATDLAKAITDNPTKYVAAPEGVTGTDATTYAGMFEATASGTTVTLKLTDEATNTLTIAVNESVTNATTAAALVTPTAESATISNATPGMYYWIEGDDDVTHKTFGSAGASVQATSANKTSLELTKPTGFTTKAFYKIAVDFKAPPAKEE